MKVLTEEQKEAISLLNGIIKNIDVNLKKYRDAIKNLQKDKEHFVKIKKMIN